MSQEQLTLAAKQVINHWQEFGPESGFDEIVYRLEKALSATPPAQASQGEPAEIMQMVDTLIACMNEAHHANSEGWRDACFQSADRVREKIKDAVTALTEQQAAQGAGEVVAWTSVKDALPDGEPGDPEVIFYSDDLRNPVDTAIGVYREGKWFSCGFEFVNVTHWKPKPANPSASQPAAGADVLDAKRWQLRCETLRALFPSAPSDYELDAAFDAAIAASGRQS